MKLDDDCDLHSLARIDVSWCYLTDLADGGAEHFASTVREIKTR